MDRGTIWWSGLCGNDSLRDAFWSYDVIVNTSEPDLTECLQLSALSWLPGVQLAFCSIFYIPHLYLSQTLHTACGTSWFNKLKTTFVLVLAALAVAGIVHTIISHTGPLYLVKYAVDVFTYLLAVFLMWYEYTKGVTSSGVVVCFWVISVLCQTVTFRSVIISKDDYTTVMMVVFFSTYVVLLLELVMHFFADVSAASRRVVAMPKPSEEQSPLLANSSIEQKTHSSDHNPCPELVKPFLSRITFAWVFSLLRVGYKRPITALDVWDLRPPDTCDVIMKRFYKAWCSSANKKKTHTVTISSPSDETTVKSGYSTFSPQPLLATKGSLGSQDAHTLQGNIWSLGSTLFPAISKTIGFYFSLLCVYESVNVVATYVRPLIFDALLNYLEGDQVYVWQGYFYVGLLLVVNLLKAIISQQTYYHRFIMGMRVRSALTGSVYRKSLRLSSEARQSYSVGEISNLMSVDAQRIAEAMFFVPVLLFTPITIAVGIWLLWQYQGVATLAGLALLIFQMVINVFITMLNKNFQVKNMFFKDKRLKTTNEIFNSIKVIKLYGWEEAFKRKVLQFREKELSFIRKSGFCIGSILLNFSCVQIFFAVFTFAAFTLTSGHELTPSIAFVTLTLITSMSRPLGSLPLGIANLVQAYVSLKRIEKFLNQGELNEQSVTREKSGDVAVSCAAGNFKWAPDDAHVLQDINFRLFRGQLVAVVGQVGSGKSSLVSALLGELHKTSGYVTMTGNTAYVAQEAWIRNETLEKNILFGESMNRSKYNTAVEACALTPDLKQLPAGDQTEIGEKGINLSGGQKQRVSVARAVYRDADIYLMDDPLSAVDAHVGRHIFKHVIGPTGVLRNKTRLLVTHSLTYLPEADVVIVMRNGRISEIGTFTDLLESNGAFAELAKSYLSEDTDDDLEEGEKEIREVLRRQLSKVSLEKQASDSDKSSVNTSKSGIRKRLSRRQSSMATSKSTEEKPKQPPTGQKLIEKEKAATGRVKWSVVGRYTQTAGILFGLLLVVTFLMDTASQVFGNIWLSLWSDDVTLENPPESWYRVAVYGVTGLATGLLVLCETFWITMGTWRASHALHTNMLDSLMRAPMSFFDTTPGGRIMNRLTQDMSVVDSMLRMNVVLLTSGMVILLATVVGITYSTPIFLALLLPLGVAYVLIQKFYISTSNQLRRLLNVQTSPIYSQFQETITGASTIRAFNRQGEFIETSDRLIDSMQMAKYGTIVATRWLNICLELLGNCIVLFSGIYAVASGDAISAGLAGLSITYSLQVTERLAMLVQNTCDAEANVVSIERILEYTTLPSESLKESDYSLLRTWPTRGAIEFKGYSTRYRPGLDLVLDNISLTIAPNEKLGIVGRTGAGKSSMMLALFRLIEASSGSIIIDGQDISEIGLHDLRTRLTIIPQDPVLFSGTLRENVDPFEQYSDQELWTALAHAHLKEFVSSLPEQLYHMCTEGGQNLSVGQRQLLCLARALLRKSKILVLDEATAAVDLETDDLIQQTIRDKFWDCTVLTIAHRLNTVMDYDRVLVLESGQIKELGDPAELSRDSNTEFYSMIKSMGLG